MENVAEKDPRDVLRYWVTGAIERGEKQPIFGRES
jgi:hypothetical protein